MEEVGVQVEGVQLPGLLTVPADPKSLIVFAHGSGSSRLSRRNQAVAEELHGDRHATLLFDLLTEAEGRNRTNVFDIELLAARLTDATRWARTQRTVPQEGLGLFGASTGAAAALVASVRLDGVSAVVSRGGRPDLADRYLERVQCPTLLIVGSRDAQVLELNREAMAKMTAPVDLTIVPGATHLFEEPGALEEVARLARQWFSDHVDRE